MVLLSQLWIALVSFLFFYEERCMNIFSQINHCKRGDFISPVPQLEKRPCWWRQGNKYASSLATLDPCDLSPLQKLRSQLSRGPRCRRGEWGQSHWTTHQMLITALGQDGWSCKIPQKTYVTDSLLLYKSGAAAGSHAPGSLHATAKIGRWSLRWGRPGAAL